MMRPPAVRYRMRIHRMWQGHAERPYRKFGLNDALRSIMRWDF